MLQITIIKGVSTLLALMLFLLTQSASIFLPSPQFKINSWNGKNQYQATFNNKPLIIHLEEKEESKPGKIKIIFKDDKTKGTTLIYERQIGGEISNTDQEYIERILTNIEKFHRDNRTYNQIRDKLDGFWKGLRRNGNR